MGKVECTEQIATTWDKMPKINPGMSHISSQTIFRETLLCQLTQVSMIPSHSGSFCQVLLGKPLGNVDSPLTLSTINSFISFQQRINYCSDLLWNLRLLSCLECVIYLSENKIQCLNTVYQNVYQTLVAFFIWGDGLQNKLTHYLYTLGSFLSFRITLIGAINTTWLQLYILSYVCFYSASISSHPSLISETGVSLKLKISV